MPRRMTKKFKKLDPDLRSDEERDLLATLHHHVVGQDTAIRVLVDAFEIYRSGLRSPDHTIANLMFLGTTGCGKTHTFEVMAEALFGTKKALKVIECSEFQHGHEVARLTGAPPGFLGHKDTPAYLRQENLDDCHTKELALTLILFDEIEKANESMWNLLLGITDKATCTLGDNRVTNFSKCIVGMTGNLGSREIHNLIKGGMGFSGSAPISGEALNKEVDKTALEAARKRFTPEFLNRIDDIVVFHALDEPQLQQVIEIELENVQTRVFGATTDRAFVLDYTPEAKSLLLSTGTDVKNGARPLKRTIEKLLMRRLSRFLNTKQVNMGDLIMVDAEGDHLSFTRVAEGVILPESLTHAAP